MDELELENVVDTTSQLVNNTDVTKLLAAMTSTKDLTKAGVSKQADGTFKLVDEVKLMTFVKANIKADDADDDVAAEADSAALWLKTNKKVSLPIVNDDDLLEGIVKGVGFRRSRFGDKKGEVVGFTLRLKTVEAGTVRNRRISLHVNYVKAMVAGTGKDWKGITAKQAEEHIVALRNKGVLIQVTKQIAGQTGYFVASEVAMNEREKAAYAACTDKTSIHTNNAKAIGFVHMTSGNSYSISSELMDDEVAAIEDAIVKADAAKQKGADAYETTLGAERAKADSLETQLVALNRLLDKRLIKADEYTIRRNKLMTDFGF